MLKKLARFGPLALAVACTSPEEDVSDPSPLARPGAVVPLSGGSTGDPPELVDTKGRRWVFKRSFPAFATGRPTLDSSGSGTYVADSLSDDELAEALRPARLHGLSEYVLDIPHADLLATAKNARAKSKSGEAFRHPGPAIG